MPVAVYAATAQSTSHTGLAANGRFQDNILFCIDQCPDRLVSFRAKGSQRACKLRLVVPKIECFLIWPGYDRGEELVSFAPANVRFPFRWHLRPELVCEHACRVRLLSHG